MVTVQVLFFSNPRSLGCFLRARERIGGRCEKEEETLLRSLFRRHRKGTDALATESKRESNDEEGGSEDDPARVPWYIRLRSRLRSRRPILGEHTQDDFARGQRLIWLEYKHGMPKRFVAAIFGGLSVIAPMLVMAIHPSEVKTLVTASVAVVGFSLALAWKSSAQVETLLATTAAYAAVLVVFVGVNGH